MGDHALMSDDKKGWKTHDDHLRGTIRFTREVLKRQRAIEKNGRETAECLGRITDALGVTKGSPTDDKFFEDNIRNIINAPHNPEMSPAAIKQHHQNVEKIVRRLKNQIEQSAQLNKAFKDLHRHQNAIMKMFKK